MIYIRTYVILVFFCFNTDYNRIYYLILAYVHILGTLKLTVGFFVIRNPGCSFYSTRNWKKFFFKTWLLLKISPALMACLSLFAYYPPDQIMKLQLQFFKGNRWKSQITIGLTNYSGLRSKNQNFLILFWQLSGLKELNSIIILDFWSVI